MASPRATASCPSSRLAGSRSRRGEEATDGTANILVVDAGLVLAQGQLQGRLTGIRIPRHHLELGHAAIEHQGVPCAHVDQHAAIGLGHGADLHLLGELANGLIPLIEQHQVLFRGALGADDGLVQIVDAVQQAVHPVRLVPYGGVDGIGLLVELGGEGMEPVHHAAQFTQGRLAPSDLGR